MMNDIVRIETEEHFLPQFAIVGYKKTRSYHEDDHYFTYHKVKAEKLTAGTPLTKDTAKNIFECLEGDLIKYSFKGIIPNSLLHFEFKGNLNLLWTFFPKQTTLHFKERTGISTGLYPIPKLVFCLQGNCLRVFAIDRKDRIEPSTRLLYAPFLNVGTNGNVCMGTASINYEGFEYYEDIMCYVERQFFNSVFTEIHNNKLIKGNIVERMKSIQGIGKFDDRLLISSNLQLKDLYEK